jgi:hypothetical protein
MSLNTGRRGNDSWLNLGSRGIGLLAVVAGLLGAGYLLATSVFPHLFSDSGTLAAENAPVFLVWSIILIGLSVSAGYGIWKRKVWTVWGLVVIVSGLSLLSLFSFGIVTVPFAVLLLVAAILLTLDQRFTVAE